MKKVSKSKKETIQIAKMFLQKNLKKLRSLQGALVVSLSGELGAGKTTFTQAVARYLGIKNKVNSPTFVIMKKYPIPKQARWRVGPIKNLEYKFLFHLDAYRLKNEKELLHLGWEEIINKKEHLVFIEWPENVLKIIPVNSKFIHISHTLKGHRSFKFK